MGWCAWDQSCRHEVLRRDARRDATTVTTVGIIATWKFHNCREDSHKSVYIFRTIRKLLLSTTDRRIFKWEIACQHNRPDGSVLNALQSIEMTSIPLQPIEHIFFAIGGHSSVVYGLEKINHLVKVERVKRMENRTRYHPPPSIGPNLATSHMGCAPSCLEVVGVLRKRRGISCDYFTLPFHSLLGFGDYTIYADVNVVEVVVREVVQGRFEEFLNSRSDPVPYFVLFCQFDPLRRRNFKLLEPVSSEFDAVLNIPHCTHVEDVNQNLFGKILRRIP